MTLWANRDGENVTIHGNIGLSVQVRKGQVAEYSIDEHYGHLRNFAGHLVKLCDEADAAAKAEAAQT